MAKKRKESTIREKLRIKAELVKLLGQLFDGFVKELLRDHHDSLLECDDGPLVLLDANSSTKRHYTFRPEASDKSKAYITGSAFIQALLANRKRRDFVPTALSLFVGLTNGWLISSDELAYLNEKVDRLTKHRVMGGKASKRLSTEQEKIAKEFVQAELRPGVSMTAACNRAASKLLKERQITVSSKTLSRLFS